MVKCVLCRLEDLSSHESTNVQPQDYRAWRSLAWQSRQMREKPSLSQAIENSSLASTQVLHSIHIHINKKSITREKADVLAKDSKGRK